MTGSQNNAQVNKLLTNISNKIVPDGSIAEQILPLINVVQSSGLLGGYGTSHLRIETSLTTGKNKVPRIDTRSYTTTAYSVDDHGLSDIITKRDYANVEAPFDAENDTIVEIVTKLQLEKEKGLADTLTSTAIITQNTTLSGTSQFSDYTNSDPLGKFSTARAAIYNATGSVPNKAIMSWAVYDKIRYHPSLLVNLGYNYDRPGGLSVQELARALDVQEILVGKAVYESAKEGQSSSIAPVWGKHIVFAVAPAVATRTQTSLGYRIQLFGAPRKVYKNAVTNPPESTEIIVMDSYQQLISKATAAYLIKDAIA